MGSYGTHLNSCKSNNLNNTHTLTSVETDLDKNINYLLTYLDKNLNDIYIDIDKNLSHLLQYLSLHFML